MKHYVAEKKLNYKKLKEEIVQVNRREDLISQLNKQLSQQKIKYFQLAKTVRKVRKIKSTELGQEISKRLKKFPNTDDSKTHA